jgi:hypothetical protein
VTKDIDERFWEKVVLEDSIFPENGCMLWASSKGHGYGIFWANGKYVPAHRWLYERLRGPVPDGLQLDHLCRVRHCVNPDHVEPVTCKENIGRGDTGWNNKSKTYCPHGHEYTSENTYIQRSGGRICRTCNRESKKKK